LKTFLLRLCQLALIGLLLLLAFGYGGALHPAGDSFAVFRAQIAIATALAALAVFLLGALRWAAVGLLSASFAGLPILLASAPPYTSGGGILLYQKNMLFINDDLAALQADIRDAAPAVLTLQEVSHRNRAMLTALQDILPHQMVCPLGGAGGTAIATKFPLTDAPLICESRFAAMQVTGPDGPVWLVSVHLHWPWPHGQAAQFDRLIPVLERLDGAIIMAGDFNMVPWSHTMRRIAVVTDTGITGPSVGTYAGFGRWLMLPIDHVLSPHGGTVTLRPLVGSDHHGLLANLP
jgi:endonuclease/exonuclease/phosphatase (EEP) superfamily protein YafD